MTFLALLRQWRFRHHGYQFEKRRRVRPLPRVTWFSKPSTACLNHERFSLSDYLSTSIESTFSYLLRDHYQQTATSIYGPLSAWKLHFDGVTPRWFQQGARGAGAVDKCCVIPPPPPSCMWGSDSPFPVYHGPWPWQEAGEREGEVGDGTILSHFRSRLLEFFFKAHRSLHLLTVMLFTRAFIKMFSFRCWYPKCLPATNAKGCVSVKKSQLTTTDRLLFPYQVSIRSLQTSNFWCY